MVEVFGFVAGGAGLLSLSVQLLESVSKLKQFQANFRGKSKAPLYSFKHT